MILDRTWNKQNNTLTISYVDKNGDRQFFRKQMHHWKTYEYDKNGEFNTWNGKKCNKVYKDVMTGYTPTEFDVLEYMYELPKEMNELLHAVYTPKVYTFDIETEVSDEFPDPAEAKQKVTAISLVNDKLDCIVYGLHKMSEESIAIFKERYIQFIKDNHYASLTLGDYNPKVLYQYFPNEADMLKHFFTVIVPKIAVLAGWNSYRFDWQYLVNRLYKLFTQQEALNILRKSSPTGELGKVGWAEPNGDKYWVKAPKHTCVMDYMELVKQYDRSINPKESFSLDWISAAAFKAHKVKYDGTLQQLYERDHEWYYFYNAVDSLLVQLIHKSLKSIKSPCASGSITLVPLLQALGQVALTNANMFWEFYSDNVKVVWDYDAIERQKKDYEGAFCGCVPGYGEWCACFDFASLYPSQIITCNLSMENYYPKMIGPDSLGRYTQMKWSENELAEFRKDPNYFVTVNGNVYKNDKDYAFRKMQTRIKNVRNTMKYTAQRLETELLTEIDRLIEEKENKLKEAA